MKLRNMQRPSGEKPALSVMKVVFAALVALVFALPNSSFACRVMQSRDTDGMPDRLEVLVLANIIAFEQQPDDRSSPHRYQLRVRRVLFVAADQDNTIQPKAILTAEIRKDNLGRPEVFLLPGTEVIAGLTRHTFRDDVRLGWKIEGRGCHPPALFEVGTDRAQWLLKHVEGRTKKLAK